MAKKKYYVVWVGRDTGVYYTWDDCFEQIQGFPGALYKSFGTLEAAKEAFSMPYADFTNREKNHKKKGDNKSVVDESFLIKHNVNPESLAVDASCLGNPGKMEYRGVYIKTGQEVFRVGPLEMGTNNIGEFLALVHALALLTQKNNRMDIYSDSTIAIGWVLGRKCKTKLERSAVNDKIFELIERAELWLANNKWHNHIKKWNTELLGEIPADFNRK